ncbi:DUF2950 domain-containing protein [Paraburkholderia lycopersici]|uniref:DUF2950 domain-containing protein n=1 Tax=Paraburkholderia lycopersici TaxID=416944 RepID=A0A1G7D0C7_9BURK|nr:DUF2950 domain-containing protein [Paraburkholderia lycopersici]SDE44185.1 Protein of unknown function [Paraburkholderia lycopersici]
MDRLKTGNSRPENDMTHQSRPDALRASFPRCVARVIAAVTVTAAGFAMSADASAQRAFRSPDEAAAALAAAWQGGSTESLLEIFGPQGEKLVRSGDPIAERLARERLASAYAEQHLLEAESDGKAQIVLGKNAWPYPVPLVKRRDGWVFDVKAGSEQILERRIGRNELDAIAVCGAYVRAQYDYAARDPAGTGLHEYARKVASTQGQHDGLYWPVSGDSPESPLGPLVATAEAQGYGAASAAGQTPFHGYYYRILTRQGVHAAGGARDYFVDGHLTGGFALLAFPARYGDSGVMTFIVNESGIVFERNLGLDTASVAAHITQFDPDRSWKVVRP